LTDIKHACMRAEKFVGKHKIINPNTVQKLCSVVGEKHPGMFAYKCCFTCVEVYVDLYSAYTLTNL